MEALARLLVDEDAPEWALRLPNGFVLAQEPIFAAAAVERLVLSGKEVTFNKETFLQRALELAELDTIG